MYVPIHALIFDLDDTLVVEERSAEKAFVAAGRLAESRYGLDPDALHKTVRQVCRELWYGFPAHPYCRRIGISSWEGMWAEFLGPAPELQALRDWAPIYRRESWHGALRRHGIEDADLAEALADAFPRLRRQIHEVYPDTVPTLRKLCGRYPLGLLTNGVSDLQRRKIAGSGVGHYFSEILISGEVGARKPDRLVFDTLLARLRTAPDRALMIGNSLATDVQGAHNAGMRTVWVNRAGVPPDPGIAADWEISTLADLDAILDAGAV